MDLEQLEEADLDRLRSVYERLAERARRAEDGGQSSEGVPDIGELTDRR
jgi:hypothetical protein